MITGSAKTRISQCVDQVSLGRTEPYRAQGLARDDIHPRHRSSMADPGWRQQPLRTSLQPSVVGGPDARRARHSLVVVTTFPTAPLAALTLVVGYLVADLTAVRALGGVVLVVGVGVCALQWRRRVGVGRTLLLVAVFLALFVGSHLLALAVGAWPSVLTVAAAMWAVAFVVADRERAPDAHRAPATRR